MATALSHLRGILKLSTRNLPLEFGIKLRSIMLAHYRIKSASPESLLRTIYQGFKEPNLNTPFFKRYIEFEYNYLKRLEDITAKHKGQTVSHMESSSNLLDINFLGCKWKIEVQRVSNELGITLPTFTDFAVYAPKISKILKSEGTLTLLNEEDVINAAKLYSDYKYITNSI